MSQAGPLNELASPTIPTQFTADVGVAVPAANNLNVFGGTDIQTIGGGSTLIINFTGTQIDTITGDSGGAVSPTAGNWNLLGSGSITTVGNPGTSTMSFELTGLTNHSVLVGAGTTTITKVGPVATTGSFLASQGVALDPVFSTATYPLTTAINEILYSSAANTVAGITASNNGVLISSALGVPSWLAAGTTGQVLLATTGAPASWASVAAAGAIITITGDSGGAETPTAGGNFNILGTGSITVAGSANTETVQLTGLTNHAVLIGAGTATITNVGPVASTGNVLMSNGAASDPGFSTATYPISTTINRILYSSSNNVVDQLATANQGVLTTGLTGIPVITALAADGQLIIGSTAGVPAAATLSAGVGISIANGSNSITISALAAGVTWNNTTGTSDTMVRGNAYQANNAGLVTYTMPSVASSTFGDTIQVSGFGSGGWLIQCVATQLIHYGSLATSAAGSLASTNRYDGVTLVCSSTTTEWFVIASQGALTVA